MTSLLIILIWIIIPRTLLLVFFIVAAYHFGKEDADFLKKEKKTYDVVLYFLKGLAVIVSPLIFHKIETILIFQSLNFNISGIIFVENIFLYILLFFSFTASVFLLTFLPDFCNFT